MGHGPNRKIAPGAIILGALGLLLGIIAVVVPWSGTMRWVDEDYQTTTVGFSHFGLAAALIAGGLLVAAATIPVVLRSADVVRQVVTLGGLAAAAVAAAGLVLVELQLRLLKMSLARQWAKLPGVDDGADQAFQAGPMLAGLAILVLALALARAAWPALAVRCYGAATLAAMALGFLYPWGYQRAAIGDGVTVRDFWFFSFGGLGIAIAVTGAYAIAAVILTVVYERRAWWPSVFAASAPLLVIVAMFFIDPDHVDGTFAGASKVDNVVNNSGVAAVYLMLGFVTALCLLVTAVRATRRPATVTVPALDPDRSW